MQTTHRASLFHRPRPNASGCLKGVLLCVLTAAYVGVVFTLVVAVAVLPFGNPNDIFVPPSWLLPLVGHADLLDAFLAIVFGPTLGVSLVAAAVVLLTAPRAYRWLRAGVDDLLNDQQDKTAAQQGQCGRFRYRSTIEGEYGIESRRGSAADNVRADPQPVGVERLVANPALQIGGGRWERRSRRNDRSGCR